MKTNAIIGVLHEDGTILPLYRFENGREMNPHHECVDDHYFRGVYANIKDWLNAFPKCLHAYLIYEEGMHYFGNGLAATGIRLDENFKPLRDADGKVSIIEMSQWFDEEAKSVTDLVVSQL